MADSAVVEVNDVNLKEKDTTAVLRTENRKLKKKLKDATVFGLVCGVIALVALAVVMGVLMFYSMDKDTPRDGTPKECGTTPPGIAWPRFYLGEPEDPGPFHDITATEIKHIKQYLKDNKSVTIKAEDALFNETHIYSIDLEPPNKADVLNYTDHHGKKPGRFARVYLFRGDINPPAVEELICGPLHNISCTFKRSSVFMARPIETKEYNAYEEKLLPDIQTEFGGILSESFGGSFDYENCEEDCFNWYASLLGAGIYEAGLVRKIWLRPMYDVPYYSLFPVDIAFLCNVDGPDPNSFSVEKLWYAGEFFDDTKVFKERYANNSITKISRTYPTKEQARFATLNRRGAAKPANKLRPPELVEPDGKRYSIRHRKVDYLDMWSFYFRNSPLYGPILNDIRFLGDRIVYELSLQELASVYTGSNPQSRTQYFLHSAFQTGAKSKVLVPGIDCPKTATFLPITVTAQDREEPAVFKRSICVFEQNTGTPLRRHHSYSQDEKSFYGGMSDSSLVLRSIHTVDNNDLIIDFTFHQTGAIGVSVLPTGYIIGMPDSSMESHYGHHIHDFLFGSMNQFLANFKVDLDVGGTTENVYETIEIREETVTLRGTNPPRTYSQTKFDYVAKPNEKTASYEQVFEQPVQHIFHNNASRNKFNERKAYRIVNQSPSKQLLVRDVGTEPFLNWARYQIAVTKRKEIEQRSGLVYSQYLGVMPLENLEDFISDNEDIVDEDLVAWVTVGSHNIPTSEDLPVSNTVGKKMAFYLMPHNYFLECPSMTSRDSVHIDETDPDMPTDGLAFDFYGTGDVANEENGGACTNRPLDFTKMWKNKPDELFEINYSKGVY